jgi:imidazolonepropionase-like amidohydrolase
MRVVSKLKAAWSLALATLAFAPVQALAATTVVHAGHLIAEPGKPVKVNQSVVIEDGKVVAIRDGFVPGDKVVELRDAWVMPGLIDMHTHVTGQLELDQPVGPQIAMYFMGRPAERALATLPRLKALLMQGFTTIRNVGDPTSTTYALRDAVAAGWAVGPRMFVTEAQISVAGGDFDPSQWEVRHDLEPFVTGRGNCSGPVECTKVVREEVRRGADVVKFRQSGTPALDPKVEMTESPEEITAIISTTHQLNRKVAVHVVGSPAFLHAVIEAGADTIEHGPLDDASIALMRKHGTFFTPTVLAQKMIDYRTKDVMEGLGKAYRAGVPIVFGTDLGIFGPERTHEEFALMQQAGMAPADVLRAATLNAANALGRGDSLGSIAPGKMADLIALKVDPLAHLDAVAQAGNVVFVMKQGEIFKQTP